MFYQYYRRNWEFGSDNNFYQINKKFVEIWTKLFISSVIFEVQKKADHILEMPRLEEFYEKQRRSSK